MLEYIVNQEKRRNLVEDIQQEENFENYTDILCRYFRVNIMLSTLEDNEILKNSLIKLHDINSFKSFKNYKDQDNTLKKSMSFNSITEVNLYNLVDCIITSNKKNNAKSFSNSVKYDIEEDSSKSKSNVNVDNLKGLITNNIDVDETIKILLVGEKEIKSKFLRALKYGDSNINFNEVSSINDGIGSLDIVKEKVNFYDFGF